MSVDVRVGWVRLLVGGTENPEAVGLKVVVEDKVVDAVGGLVDVLEGGLELAGNADTADTETRGEAEGDADAEAVQLLLSAHAVQRG